MKLTNLALVLVSAAALAGCQVARTSEPDRAEALEKRIQELEQRLAAAQSTPAAAPASRPASSSLARRAPAARPATQAVPATPAPAPAPVPVAVATPRPLPPPELVLSRGTKLAVVLKTALTSAESREGDEVVARVESAEAEGGAVALPGGAVLHGRVIDARSSGRVKGRARLTVEFDRMVLRGESRPIEATAISVEAEKDTKRDAAMVGGGAVAGAVIGAIAGGKDGAAKGAAIGAAAGGGAVLATKGGEAELPAGSRWTVELQRTIRF